MSEHAHLIPATAKSYRENGKRIPFAFGRRFFLLLLIGLVWIGPAWNDHRFLYAMLLWDLSVFALWLWDLKRLPRPARFDVSRIWTAAPQLGLQGKVRIEIQCIGA